MKDDESQPDQEYREIQEQILVELRILNAQQTRTGRLISNISNILGFFLIVILIVIAFSFLG